MAILAILIVLAAGTAVAYSLFGEKILSIYKGQPQDKEDKEVPKVEETKKVEIGPILSLEPFLFNVAGSPSRFAKISIGVELKDKEAAEEGRKLTPLLRDKVLFVLSKKGSDVLMDVNGRRHKQEVFAALKDVFPKEDAIRNVYITDIIIQ
jgi:flagellar basal body-associated protein FliL